MTCHIRARHKANKLCVLLCKLRWHSGRKYTRLIRVGMQWGYGAEYLIAPAHPLSDGGQLAIAIQGTDTRRIAKLFSNDREDDHGLAQSFRLGRTS